MTAPNLEPAVQSTLQRRLRHITHHRIGSQVMLNGATDLDVLAAAVVAAIRDSGFTVIALPEGQERGHTAYGDDVRVIDYLHWKNAQITVDPEGMVRRGEQYVGPYIVRYMGRGTGIHYTVESARQYATALLAAADVAELKTTGAALIAAAEHAGDTQ